MAIGETLLKITDYPFVYSLALIHLHFSGISPLSPDGIIFLAVAGFAGTVLTIIDPVGRGFKLYTIGIEKASFKYYNST
ncbi:MAG: hypothetical protein ACRD9Q_10415, partial [Nitrososphaeraceae archaeon]